MGEFVTNRLWDTGRTENPSKYARMIPGASAIPLRGFTVAEPVPKSSVAQSEQSTVKRPVMATSTRQPSSQTTVDRFTLFELMVADVMALVAALGGLSLISPAWGLPRHSLPVFVVLVMLFGLCEGIYKRAGDPSPAGVILALSRSTLCATALVFIAAGDGMRPIAAGGLFASSLTGLVLSRKLRQVAWKKWRRDPETRKILIIGGGPVGRSIARALRNDSPERTTVCGFLDNEQPLSPAVLGRIEDLDWLARAEFIDEVILALPGHPAETRKAAEVAFRNHLDILAVLDLPPGPWPDSGVDRIGEVPVVTLHRESLPSASLFLKRLLDVVGATVGLVLAGPAMIILALFIRLDSPGKVVYAAERTGAKGRRFRCYKFRSMVSDAAVLKEDLRARNQREGPIFKLDDDPRITRVGRMIRRYSLDELPQLWNVLRGEMSLVGPRPHPVDEVNHYELHEFRRLDVKPGITGLWQITARNCPSFELNMHLDLTYIEQWSLLLDLRILAGTVRVLFAPEGA